MNISFREEPPAPERVLICFSHLRWRFVFQRPQHLLTRAARDWQVYFLEEVVYEDGLAQPRLDRFDGAPGVTVCVPVLPTGTCDYEALKFQERCLDEILNKHRSAITAFWYYTPRAVHFSLHREPDLCVYDCMDELSAFKGAHPDLESCERNLFAVADIVFTGGHALYEAKWQSHPNVHPFPSSVDKAHFRTARKPVESDPGDQRDIPHPRIGFFGVIDERFDVGLVDALSQAKPDWHFVMLGPIVKIDEASLPQRDNLHWLGCKSYADLPRYLAYWDAGFMPFAMNASTRFISPTKTPEFLAAGLPVVSTPVRDVKRDWGDAGLVAIARSPEDFAAELAEALSAPRERWLHDVDERLSKVSWDLTWERMNALMQHELSWRLQWRKLSPRLNEPSYSTAEADNV